MIRNVLIMAGSGLALFYKEFQNSLDANRSKILCALITTVLEFSKQTTGMAVSFIEFSHLFLTIVTHEPTKISCAVFYDRGDGKLFGRLICGEILNAFVQDYPIEIFQQGPNLKDFKGFYQRMPAVIYYSVKPVLLKLEGTTGINRAILVRDKEVIHTHQYPEVDCFTLLTNLSTFVEMADNMILEGNDFVQNIAVDTDEQQRLIIWKVRQHCLLICLIDATIPSEEYADNVEEALELIEQIGNLHEDLKMIMNREK